MRFAFLGSGSRGNGLVVAQGDTRVLIDCGFACAEAERRLARLGVAPASLDAVLVTHEHVDHLRGVARLALRHKLAVWMTPGTFSCWRDKERAALAGQTSLFSPHEPFAVNGLAIQPYPVPHDAREPCQFVVSDGAFKLGVLSDIGRVTAHVRDMVTACDALVLEANHDAAMLAAGPYPVHVKRRVAGAQGHLSNAEAAGLLGAIDASALQHIVAAHISANNNTHALARAALAAALNCEERWVAVADQDEGLDWRRLATR